MYAIAYNLYKLCSVHQGAPSARADAQQGGRGWRQPSRLCFELKCLVSAIHLGHMPPYEFCTPGMCSDAR